MVSGLIMEWRLCLTCSSMNEDNFSSKKGSFCGHKSIRNFSGGHV